MDWTLRMHMLPLVCINVVVEIDRVVLYVFAFVPLTTQSHPSKEFMTAHSSWCRTAARRSEAEGGIDGRWQSLMTFCDLFSSISFTKMRK
jgi:hypothetical protein